MLIYSEVGPAKCNPEVLFVNTSVMNGSVPFVMHTFVLHERTPALKEAAVTFSSSALLPLALIIGSLDRQQQPK